MRLLAIALIRNLLAVVFLLSIVASSFTQNGQSNPLAARLADAIQHSGRKTVLVFDFTATDQRLAGLGTALADDLSSKIAASGPKLKVVDRSALKNMMEANGIEPANLRYPGIVPWLAEDMHAQASVIGTIKREDENVKLSVDAHRTDDGKPIVALEVTLPLTDPMKALVLDTVKSESLK